MSQYGAYGMARRADARRRSSALLHRHELGTDAAGRRRVLLAEGRRAVSISSTAPLDRDATRRARSPARRRPLTLRSGSRCSRSRRRPDRRVRRSSCARARRPSSPSTAAVPRKARARARRRLPPGRELRPLESYVQGVVAGEMPFTLAGGGARGAGCRRALVRTREPRSKASRSTSTRTSASQVYLGVAGEKPSTTAGRRDDGRRGRPLRRQDRVDVVLLDVGGKTASAQDVFGFERPVPRLATRSVGQGLSLPWWGPVVLGARTVQSKLGLDARVLDATGVATPSGRIRAAHRRRRPSGSQSVPASLVRTALGLRSTWVTVGVLRLDRPPAGPVCSARPPSSPGSGAASARRVSRPRRTEPRGAPSRPARRDADGSVRVRREADSDHALPARGRRRRVAGDARRRSLRVIKLSRADGRRAECPHRHRSTAELAGGVVTVERRKGTAWVAVGQATVDADGRFQLALAGPVPAGATGLASRRPTRSTAASPRCCRSPDETRLSSFVRVSPCGLAAPRPRECRARRRRTHARCRRRGGRRGDRATDRHRPESLAPIRALVVELPAGTSLRGIRGIRYVEPLTTRHLAFTPTDPLVRSSGTSRYSGFYSSWVTLPAVRVDPGRRHRLGRRRLASGARDEDPRRQSFVGGSAREDTLGHGTFVAGLIGARFDNGIGIAGLAPSAQLLVAKVVTQAARPSRSRPRRRPSAGRSTTAPASST